MNSVRYWLILYKNFSNDAVPFSLISLNTSLSPIEPPRFHHRSYVSLREQYSFILQQCKRCNSLPLKYNFRDCHLPNSSVFKTSLVCFSVFPMTTLHVRQLYQLLIFLWSNLLSNLMNLAPHLSVLSEGAKNVLKTEKEHFPFSLFLPDLS